MLQQLSLLSEIERLPRLNPTAPRERKARLQAACLRILRVLQLGPATNRDLLEVAGVRYGARLGELRAYLRREHGLGPDVDPIRCDEDKASGLAWYSLEIR